MQEGVWEVDGAGDVGVSKMKTLPPSATVASALFGACVSRTRQEEGSDPQGSFLCSLSPDPVLGPHLCLCGVAFPLPSPRLPGLLCSCHSRWCII